MQSCVPHRWGGTHSYCASSAPPALGGSGEAGEAEYLKSEVRGRLTPSVEPGDRVGPLWAITGRCSAPRDALSGAYSGWLGRGIWKGFFCSSSESRDGRTRHDQDARRLYRTEIHRSLGTFRDLTILCGVPKYAAHGDVRLGRTRPRALPIEVAVRTTDVSPTLPTVVLGGPPAFTPEGCG